MLQILNVLWRAYQRGELVTLAQLTLAIRLPLEHLERLLDALAGAGWIARTEPNRWLLRRNAAAIKIEDVYRRFVFASDAHSAACRADPELAALADDIGRRVTADMQRSLEQLFTHATQPGAVDGPALRVKTV